VHPFKSAGDHKLHTQHLSSFESPMSLSLLSEIDGVVRQIGPPHLDIPDVLGFV
jgi:hypothetical protein